MGDEYLLLVAAELEDAAYGVSGAAAPVAGLLLTREQAHELLRMLAEQADQAEWALPRRLGWLRRGLPG